MWTEGEQQFLEDVKMDLIPDDEALNTKGKTVMKWDKVKKRYLLQKVDREGKVVKEKRNESGKKIKGKKDIDETAIYKKWQKNTL
jgi:hypothetical protein